MLPLSYDAIPLALHPERALVFITAVPIGDFGRAARLVGLEVLSEIELEEDYDLPDDLIAENASAVAPTLYTSMPTQDSFNRAASSLARIPRRE